MILAGIYALVFSSKQSNSDKRQVEIEKKKNIKFNDVDVLELIKVNFNHK